MGSSSSTPTVAPSDSKPAAKKCEGDSCKLDTKPKVQSGSEEQPKKLKPCCACPETKKARDTCIVERGEENCKDLIEAHKECMRKLGFNI